MRSIAHALIIAVLVCVAIPAAAHGPERDMLRGHATIATGMALQDAHQNLYVHGGADLYRSARVSLRGDSFLFVGEQSGRGMLTMNHAFFGGASYHPLDGRFDPYVAFQPGLAVVRASWRSDGSRQWSATKVTPVLSGVVGANYFISRNFHVFAEGRPLSGRYLSDAPTPIALEEVRVSFGLGAQLRLHRADDGAAGTEPR